MSELLTKSLAAGKVTIQKRKHVGGEVMVVYHDPSLQPVTLQGYGPVCLTDQSGVDSKTVQRSNIRDLIARGLVEVV